jgi:Na+/H+-translocating membrane pyrophosphatase
VVGGAHSYLHKNKEMQRMSEEKIKVVDEALSKVSNGRRSFLKGLLIGSAAMAALPLMKSEALAQEDNDNAPKKKKKKKGGDNDNQ